MTAKTQYMISLFLILCPVSCVSSHLMEDTLFHTIGEKYAIDPLLLYAIALNESARTFNKGFVAPHPYVFRDQDGAHYFESLEAASLPSCRV